MLARRLLIAAMGGGGFPMTSAFHGFLAYNDTTQTVFDRQTLGLVCDQNDFDTESMHFTSAAALTGTVAKTGGSATLTGTGSAFSTELSVGQVVAIQKALTGTVTITNGSTTVTGSSTAFLTECYAGQMLNVGATGGNTLWIKSITTNTSLVVDHPPQNLSPNPAVGQSAWATELVGISAIGGNTTATLYKTAQTTASGITANRVSYAACVKTAGYWTFYAYYYPANQPSQDAPCVFMVNGLAVLGGMNIPWANQTGGVPPQGQCFLLPRPLVLGDIVIPTVYWDNNGGAPSSTTVGGTTVFTETVFGGYLVGT